MEGPSMLLILNYLFELLDIEVRPFFIAFIGKINQQGKADSRSGADNSNTASSNGVRSRKKAESNGVSGAYTEEQVRAVKRYEQSEQIIS